ncbi:MAG TPA: transcription-repair coupling factor [Gemmatimonadales bacterium]|nr:transcription-repair coupling factor [Gemmatimonadales bacterium]
MPLPRLVSQFGSLSEVQSLLSALRERRGTRALAALPGSSDALLVAAHGLDRPDLLTVVVAAAPADAERWLADLTVLLGEEAVALYPQREGLGEDEPHYEIAGERVETLERLNRGAARVIVTTARATAERTLIPAALEAARLELAAGVSFRDAVARLERMGYGRVPMVTDVAQFSVRGGIVDVYGFGMAQPARAEFWDDACVALRTFDLSTQRSTGPADRVTVLPVDPRVTLGEVEGSVRRGLLELLPPGSLLVEDGEARLAEEVGRAWAEAEHHAAIARRLGEAVPPRGELLVEPGAWDAARGRFPRLALGAAGGARLPVEPPPEVGRDLARLRPPEGVEALVLCDNEGQLERLEELLGEGGRFPERLHLAVGALDGGFALPGLVVFTDHQVFRRARRIRRPRRYRQASPVGAVAALKPGDAVVHLEHGVGIYRGMQTIAVADGTLDVAVVEYEGGDLLHVPLHRIDQLERFRGVDDVGGEAKPPKLDRLGGKRWARVRRQAEEAVHRLAAELLDLYARRRLAPGHAFPPDGKWQRELESSFLYEDTPDQRKATEEVKADMEAPRPMDRLVVGDVGYGKTEIAVRAAFKAVTAGKQVAVLAPTTILAEQHGRTFGERLADYPVRLLTLSRFRTPKEQRAALADLAAGKLDVVIGTHRLLSPDVQFKDLGLIVVDEEHRFGVEHKERLKRLRLAVDVLTLTATPIPRTLQLSLAGLRDLTLIETPPRDRSPVLTFVEPWDDELLEEAIARELDRGGQVYFVHNRIETIETVAERLRRLVPRAAVTVAHGEMRSRDLDEVMRRFVAGGVGVLCSTMIVESGLDVPNANTMIVHQAQQLGLAQLYQLRGRVGRSHRRAYCYLLVPDDVDRAAEARLETLVHYTELGAGYRIALKDLELRGAGNILGAEQSGFAMSVGVDVYLRMLEDTVRSLRGEARGVVSAPPEVLLDRAALLPDAYVPDDAAKLDLYRRLARSQSGGEIDQLREEMVDRFGRPPAEAEALVALTHLRVIGARLGLETVLVRGDEARLVFRAGAVPRLANLTAAMDEVQFDAEVRRAAPLVMKLRRLGGMPLVAGLVRALARAVDGTIQ